MLKELGSVLIYIKGFQIVVADTLSCVDGIFDFNTNKAAPTLDDLSDILRIYL